MIPTPIGLHSGALLPHLRWVARGVSGLVFTLSLVLPPYVPPVNSSLNDIGGLIVDDFLFTEEGFVMKTASISEQGYRRAYARGLTHTVAAGESVLGLAEFYGISADTIRWANQLSESEVLQPGQQLLILPVDGVLHTVRRGQNLTKIANLYDVPLEEIVAQNRLRGTVVTIGQELIIPGGTPLLRRPGSLARQGAPSEGSRAPRAERPRPTPAPPGVPPPSVGLFQLPCACIYTQYYHAGHYGLDLASPGGGPIFAAEDGMVVRAAYGWNGGYGNVVELDHGGGLHTIYAHNRALHVREETRVSRGEVIATMGNTGRVYGRTGVHVHFEVLLNGIKKNPLLYLQ